MSDWDARDLQLEKSRKYDAIKELFADHSRRFDQAKTEYKYPENSDSDWDEYIMWVTDTYTDWEKFLELLED